MVAVESYNWSDFAALGPVVALVVGACVLLISEVFLTSRNRGYQVGVSVVFATIAGLLAFSNISVPARDLFGGFARLDAFGSFTAVIVCFSIALTSLFADSSLKELASERGEFHALAQLAGAGMILLAQATDLITLFIALEVMSLATYALSSYLRTSPRPAEAAMKYFILGSFSSAVLLYGTALAYGAAGSTRLADIARISAAKDGPTPLLLAAIALVAAGFLFKVAAVPFHMWAPDVYDGAPTTVAGFMAGGVKAAAVSALLRTLYVAFGSKLVAVGADGNHGWASALTVIAYLTMVGGNLLAIAQKSVKRMLAYSSISHAGYLLVAVAVGGNTAFRQEATSAALFYLAAYTATALGAFAVVAALEKRGGRDIDDDTRYDGLSQREPVLALAMAVFMLSLAGIPPTAGFMAKLFIFRAALDANAYGLAVVGVLTSVAGLYYYLRVVVLMYMRPSAEGAAVPARTLAMGIGLAIAAGVTLFFGIGPNWLSTIATSAATLGQ
jgi:NADH-quinone oxidoreductase subunit N